MENLISNTVINYSELIRSGCLAVQAPLQTIKSLFQEREQYETTYSLLDKKNVFLEIVFESAMLSCLLDSNNICNKVFLYPDDILDIIRYIQYCNQAYPFDSSLEGWIVNEFLIRINLGKKECSLLISPLKKE